jgi:hypothetical protein
MPMYYFLIKRDQKAPTTDPPGLELENLEEAWEEATRTAGDLLKGYLDGSLKPGSEWSIEIRDASRRRLRTIRLTTEDHG